MMKRLQYKVYWADIAQKDIKGIFDIISLSSVDTALDILNLIKIISEGLDNFPLRGRIVPELKFHNIENYREIIIEPWRIVYRIENDKVYIISIFDGRRNFEDILLARILKN